MISGWCKAKRFTRMLRNLDLMHMGISPRLYSAYEVEPGFKKNFFGRTILKYDSISNKRKQVYWDSIRPIPLLPDELGILPVKTALKSLREDPAYLDSLDRKQNQDNPGWICIKWPNLQQA